MHRVFFIINKKFLLISLFGLLLINISCKKNDDRSQKVIVYTYNSFSNEWGIGPKIADLFKQKTGISVEYADCGDGGQILSKAILEKKDPYADVLIGLDNSVCKKAIESNILEPLDFETDVLDELVNELNDSENIYILPYDYSPFAFIYDTESSLPVPHCLEDLTNSVYKKKIILMDSRTSTPGLGFENWVNKVYKDDSNEYLKRLQSSVLTYAPSWSVGYGMFMQGEAPLVISYTTSELYHIQEDKTQRYKALEFEDGHILQVEGAAVLKNAKNLKGAKEFVKFLVSLEAQDLILFTQWMYPANKNVVLPECSNLVIKPKILK